MINNIQLLRAFAALSVVIYHTDFHYRAGIHTEFHGVAIFFVISGFIMTYLTRVESANFFYNRCVRIIPLYALITLAIFFVNLKATIRVNDFSIWDTLEYINATSVNASSPLIDLVKSLFFIPYKNISGLWYPITLVGWTLNLEMYFYILFSIALRLSPRFSPLIVIITILFINIGGRNCSDDICAFYSNYNTNYFILGILAYYVWRILDSWIIGNRKIIARGAWIIAILFFFRHLLAIPSGLNPSVVSMLDYLLPFLVVVLSLCLHTLNIQCNWPVVLLLGNISYALYLVHPPLIDKMRSAGFDPSSLFGLFSILFISIFIATLLFYFFERPTNMWLKRRFTRIGFV